MATTFQYQVRDKSGKTVEGQLEATNRSAAARALREKGMVPLKVDQVKTGGFQTEIKIPGLSGRVKQKEISIFSRQFATMVNSGLTLIRALTVLEDQVQNKALKDVLSDIRATVEQGNSLSAAMEKHPKVFSELYTSMIRAGEVGGVLDETLNRLAETLEAQVKLRSQVRSAMAYPMVVGFMITGIVFAMLTFVVPMFSAMYDDLGGSLPLPTQLLVSASDFVKSFWWAFLVLGIGGLIAFKRWIETDDGRRVFDGIKLKIPVFGGLVHKVAISRFARTLSVLSKSGVPILQALDIVSQTAGNVLLSNAVKDVQNSVKQGDSLTGPLEKHEIFPSMVTQMMAVGEETGALDTMLGKVADFYDMEVEHTVNALTSLIEPILIIVMGVTVGGILIALYLPMFNLGSLIENSLMVPPLLAAGRARLTELVGRRRD